MKEEHIIKFDSAEKMAEYKALYAKGVEAKLSEKVTVNITLNGQSGEHVLVKVPYVYEHFSNYMPGYRMLCSRTPYLEAAEQYTDLINTRPKEAGMYFSVPKIEVELDRDSDKIGRTLKKTIEDLVNSIYDTQLDRTEQRAKSILSAVTENTTTILSNAEETVSRATQELGKEYKRMEARAQAETKGADAGGFIWGAIVTGAVLGFLWLCSL